MESSPIMVRDNTKIGVNTPAITSLSKSHQALGHNVQDTQHHLFCGSKYSSILEYPTLISMSFSLVNTDGKYSVSISPIPPTSYSINFHPLSVGGPTLLLATLVLSLRIKSPGILFDLTSH